MKNKFLPLTLSFILIIYSINLQAQESNFSISGQYRVRTELRHGFRTLAADTSKAAFFIAQRARLIFGYKNEKLTTKISIQDSRTWGDEEQKKDLAGLQVNELWVQLALSKAFALKMGRQELIYDEQRLLGNLDWGNSTISHDALLLKYENKEKQLQVHIGGAFNQSGEPLFGTKYPLKNYKVLGLAWLKKEINKQNTISLIAIVNGVNSVVPTSPSIKTSSTVGPLYNFHHNGWKLVLAGYYQTGKTADNLNLNAAMVNAYVEKVIKKITLGAGVDYLTGNAVDTKPTTSHNFSTLYPTNHKFYGAMDYFLGFPADTRGRGLQDIYARLKMKASDKFTAAVDVHYFSSAHNQITSFSNVKKNLGTEVDLLTEYIPSADISLQLGYSVMLATNNMEAIKGGNKNNYNYWAFAMLKVSPVFFKHTFKN